MYTEFYGLREKPFALSPDPRYLFLADSHREALAHLLFGIEHGEGFIAITGEVGTGKTTLCRTLLQRIEPGTEVAFIFNPQLSALELLQAINAELGLATDGLGRRELMEQLNRFLLAKKAEGRRVLLLIDEAQNLAPDTLEQVRLLSNLETDTSKLIQIILIGQPELDAMLESPNLRQLRQRISVRWRLAPLGPTETRDYVRHRLRIAAGAPREIFTELALREIHRRSRGIPRLVNLLSDRALLAGYGSGTRTIGLGLVTQSDKEIRGGAASLAAPRVRRLGEWLPGLRQTLAAATLVGLGVLAAAAWQRLVWPSAPELPANGASPAAVAAPPAAEPVEPATEDAPASVPAEPAPAEPAAAGAATAPDLTPSEAALSLPPAAVGDPGGPAGEVAAVSAPPPSGAVPAPAAPEGAAAGPAPAPAAPLPSLGEALAAASPAATTGEALRELERRWGVSSGAPAFLSLQEALQALRDQGISMLALRNANRATLELFNQAALLSLRPPGEPARTVLLVGLEGGDAVLVGLRGAEPLRAPWSEVERVWTRETFIAWKDFAQLPAVLGPGQSGQHVVWLQASLQELGFLGEGDRSGLFDAATTAAVREFQRSRHLTVDGTVGPLTKAVLYQALQSFSVPRLAIAAREGVG
jgi:general secretion pathway protein A